MSELTPKQLREAAEQMHAAHIHDRDQSATWQRWVLAACLTINGGATIALMNLKDIDKESQFWSILWFIAGLILSIVFGMLNSIIYDKFSGYHYTTARALERNAAGDFEPHLDLQTFDRISNQEYSIFLMQFLCLVSFIVGVVVAVDGLK